MLQDDHYRRVADLAFRHLAGAEERFTERQKHEWIITVSNDDPKFGREEYLKASTAYEFNSSEEYTQALAAVLFSHIWLLSAANYYRLSVKHQQPSGAPWLTREPIAGTDKPQLIAEALKLPKRVVTCAESLHYIRNTIAHLVETIPQTVRIDELDFPLAYSLTKCTWVIYCALLRHYGMRPDRGSWAIQTQRYNLPRGLRKWLYSTFVLLSFVAVGYRPLLVRHSARSRQLLPSLDGRGLHDHINTITEHSLRK